MHQRLVSAAAPSSAPRALPKHQGHFGYSYSWSTGPLRPWSHLKRRDCDACFFHASSIDRPECTLNCIDLINNTWIRRLSLPSMGMDMSYRSLTPEGYGALWRRILQRWAWISGGLRGWNSARSQRNSHRRRLSSMERQEWVSSN